MLRQSPGTLSPENQQLLSQSIGPRLLRPLGFGDMNFAAQYAGAASPASPISHVAKLPMRELPRSNENLSILRNTAPLTTYYNPLIEASKRLERQQPGIHAHFTGMSPHGIIQEMADRPVLRDRPDLAPVLQISTLGRLFQDAAPGWAKNFFANLGNKIPGRTHVEHRLNVALNPGNPDMAKVTPESLRMVRWLGEKLGPHGYTDLHPLQVHPFSQRLYDLTLAHGEGAAGLNWQPPIPALQEISQRNRLPSDEHLMGPGLRRYLHDPKASPAGRRRHLYNLVAKHWLGSGQPVTSPEAPEPVRVFEGSVDPATRLREKFRAWAAQDESQRRASGRH